MTGQVLLLSGRSLGPLGQLMFWPKSFFGAMEEGKTTKVLKSAHAALPLVSKSTSITHCWGVCVCVCAGTGMSVVAAEFLGQNHLTGLPIDLRLGVSAPVG